jgi:hypothetical protein
MALSSSDTDLKNEARKNYGLPVNFKIIINSIVALL